MSTLERSRRPSSAQSHSSPSTRATSATQSSARKARQSVQHASARSTSRNGHVGVGGGKGKSDGAGASRGMSASPHNTTPRARSPSKSNGRSNTKKSPPESPPEPSGRVRVCVRVRPPLAEEVEAENYQPAVVIPFTPKRSHDGHNHKGETLELHVQDAVVYTWTQDRGVGARKSFLFDYAFGEDTSQGHVYDHCAWHVVEDVLRGYNGTIIAYGQTGTGKTYSMGILDMNLDDADAAGFIPRGFQHIFYGLSNFTGESTVSLSFCQIYLETVKKKFRTAHCQ